MISFHKEVLPNAIYFCPMSPLRQGASAARRCTAGGVHVLRKADRCAAGAVRTGGYRFLSRAAAYGKGIDEGRCGGLQSQYPSGEQPRVSGGVPGVCGKAGASLARVLCCGGGEYSATRGRRIQLVPNGALFGAVPEAASKRERHNLF